LNETLQSLQRQVVRQERLAAVGLLAAGVAHEVNNPLQAIVGAVELLERESGLSSDAREQMHFVKTQTSRAREVVRSLARFSSQQIGPPSPLDLKDIVADVLRYRSRELETCAAEVDLHFSTNSKVCANLTELEQVTSHLLLNAIQAVEAKHLGLPGGRIEIRSFDSDASVRLEFTTTASARLSPAEAVPAIFNEESRLEWAEPVGELRHHRVVWRRDRILQKPGAEPPSPSFQLDQSAIRSPARVGRNEPADDRAPLLRRPV
jgi:K+-sensing histidine kinase KdpD